MAEPDKRPVTIEELLVSSLAQTDALAKLLIEKGLITQEEFMQKISEERATYQNLLSPTPQMTPTPLLSPGFFAIFRPAVSALQWFADCSVLPRFNK
jgi:hypothetical protein